MLKKHLWEKTNFYSATEQKIPWVFQKARESFQFPWEGQGEVSSLLTN